MYKAAIIGLGKIGLLYDFEPGRQSPSSHAMAYSLHPEIELVAGADVRDEPKQYLKQLVPSVRCYSDTTEMLRCQPVDIVSICTPSAGRLELIRSVLELTHARIMFCEKPILNRLEEIPELQSLLSCHDCLLIPNLSRRWNTQTIKIRKMVRTQCYGSLQNIHICYTRGIYNTGSHLFDLIRYLSGEFESVRVAKKVYGSSERSGDPSFSFLFTLVNGATGYAEAFNDENYYLFDVHLYFENGKIEILHSGDEIRYFGVAPHPKFQGFRSLNLKNKEENLLQESSLKRAVDHLVHLLDGVVQTPICTAQDGIYPLFVADALLRSFRYEGSLEKVVTNCE